VRGDLGPAAVHDDDADTGVAQEHHVLREGGTQRLAGHRVAAVLDHHGASGELLEPGQRLDQRGSLGERDVTTRLRGRRHVEYAEFSCT
jgi:hypothetical protein